MQLTGQISSKPEWVAQLHVGAYGYRQMKFVRDCESARSTRLRHRKHCSRLRCIPLARRTGVCIADLE